MHEPVLTTEIDWKQRINKVTNRFAIAAVLCLSPVFLIFAHLGKPATGAAACICTGTILAAVRAFWDLKERVWFWVAISIVAGLHVPLVLLIPWPNQAHHALPPFTFLGMGGTDFAFVFGCISLLEKVMRRKQGTS